MISSNTGSHNKLVPWDNKLLLGPKLIENYDTDPLGQNTSSFADHSCQTQQFGLLTTVLMAIQCTTWNTGWIKTELATLTLYAVYAGHIGGPTIIRGCYVKCHSLQLQIYYTHFLPLQHLTAVIISAIRQQAITWANVDQDLWRHMASLGHNDLKRCSKGMNCKAKDWQQGITQVGICIDHNHF